VQAASLRTIPQKARGAKQWFQHRHLIRPPELSESKFILITAQQALMLFNKRSVSSKFPESTARVQYQTNGMRN
jgi:hypothetical protein